jgi:uncharacterized protein HemX
MVTTKKTETTQEVATGTTKVEPEVKPAAKSYTAIWLIIIAVFILIGLGFFIYFSIQNAGISGTILGLYVFSIILLVVGIIMAFMA